MRKYLLICYLIICKTIVFSQSLSWNTGQIFFGSVTELQTDSLLLTVTNTSTRTINIDGYKFYTTYGQFAFSTLAGNSSITPGNTSQIWIRFHPVQNIFHNSELFILNDSHEGALRIDLNGQGHFSNAYYDSTQNLEEENLKLKLKSITGNGYVSLIYGPARDSMFMKIDNKLANGSGATQNTIECIYTGRNAVGYIDRTNCQDTTYNFNTEHTFPQAFFNQMEPMRSDLFHLFPTDNTANNVRSNYPFGMVSTPTWTVGGSKYANNVFEPRDFAKGRIARAMLYFVMRYQNYNSFLDSQEATLRQWCINFPVDTIEQKRANAIASMQFNRNPFIDYPQFLDRIQSISNTSVQPIISSFDLPEDTIDFGLINAATTKYYTFWISNNGNQALSVSNISLTPSTVLAFASGTGVNVSINPGESIPVIISLSGAPLGQFSGALNFDLTGPNLTTSVNVPIKAQLSLQWIAENFSRELKVFPNPFKNEICVESELVIDEISVSTLLGQEMINTKNINEKSWCIAGDAMKSSGLYMMQIKANNKTERRLIYKD
jgi:hypothetical protein